MTIRDLVPGDLEQIAGLIMEIYAERPSAMWFESPPDADTIRRLFEYKIKGIGEGRIVDVVSEEGASIAGECEIVKMPGGIGYVGLLVRQEFRMRGIGTALLASASERARSLGTTTLKADVTEDNEAAMRFFTKGGFGRTGEGYTTVINGSACRVVTLEKRI